MFCLLIELYSSAAQSVAIGEPVTDNLCADFQRPYFFGGYSNLELLEPEIVIDCMMHDHQLGSIVTQS